MKPNASLPLTPVSCGELIDKITILEIKSVQIKAPAALANVARELAYLEAIVREGNLLRGKVVELKQALHTVNLQLWKVEDDIRDKEARQEFDAGFIALARSVYHLNDDRARLKREINEALGSELVEEKSYKDFRPAS